MTAAQRAVALRVCAALYGLAVAISMAAVWMRPAPPDQPPGFMTSIGIDAAASFRFLATVVLFPLLSSLAWGRLLNRLAADDTQRWARTLAGVALLMSLWTALITRSVAWVAIPAAIVVMTCFAARRIRGSFSRRDLILIPTTATVFMALMDIVPTMRFDHVFLVAGFLVLALRVALVEIRPAKGLDASMCFALSPLALMAQTHVFSRDQRHFGWTPLAIALLTPIAVRLLVDNTERARRRIRTALAWVIYPIACYSWLSAGSLLSAEGKPRANPFEDAQHILPAAEMMRGERAYRDIVPPHGFVQDALLDLLLMRSGADTIGSLLRGRGSISALNAVAVYAVGVAATGSAEAGLLTFFLAASLGTGGGGFRFLPALLTFAIILQAVRTRRPRLLAVGGGGVVLTFMTTIDYGFYTGIVLLIAIVRFRTLRALREGTAGVAIGAAVAAIGLALGGIFTDFFRVTFGEVARLGPVYASSIFEAPASLQATPSLPELLPNVLEPTAYLYLIWTAALIFLVVALTLPSLPLGRRRRRRLDTLIVLTSIIVVFGISYAERHHLYFQTVVPALVITTIMTMHRARSPLIRAATPVVAALALILARPTAHLAITALLRHARGPIESNMHEILDIRRGRGAYFRADDVAMIDAANRYFHAHLAPEETFFDFTNRGFLYFVLERDCPVRQLEVAFYETEKLQQEVIDRVERNPRIRVAIVPADNDPAAVDGIPNAVRAPLVWKYLQNRFTPDSAEAGLIFWRRR
jgi:hypothetical protein